MPTPAHAWHDRRICEHVTQHENGYRQGTAAWLSAKENVVGGSELATLMGLNPYQTWEGLVARKLGLPSGTPPGVACWWGTFLEPISERLLELDCATKLHGSDIHVRFPDLVFHGNSPDGYCVLTFELRDDVWELSHDPALATAEGRQTYTLPVLVELKAPYRRLLSGKTPRYYLPQVWSGIALSPPTLMGFFVEIIFRVCSLTELHEGAEYSKQYHKGDMRTKNPPKWEGAFSWGVTAIYAPMLGTRAVRALQSDGSTVGTADADAYRILCTQLGGVLKPAELGTHIADIGRLANDSPSDFDKVLGHINSKELTYRHSDPVGFEKSGPADGSDGLGVFMDNAEGTPPPNYYLFGFLPWKVFQIDYHVVQEQPGFYGKIDELTTEFMGDVQRLRAAENPRLAYHEYCVSRMKESGGGVEPGARSGGATADQKSALFAWATKKHAKKAADASLFEQPAESL